MEISRQVVRPMWMSAREPQNQTSQQQFDAERFRHGVKKRRHAMQLAQLSHARFAKPFQSGEACRVQPCHERLQHRPFPRGVHLLRAQRLFFGSNRRRQAVRLGSVANPADS